MLVYAYNTNERSLISQRMKLSDYLRQNSSFHKRRDADLSTITNKLDIWSDLVRSKTGYMYDAVSEIEKYSDLPNVCFVP